MSKFTHIGHHYLPEKKKQVPKKKSIVDIVKRKDSLVRRRVQPGRVLEIVSRGSWRAEPPQDALVLRTPVLYVHVDVAARPVCVNMKECSASCRKMQKEAMEIYDLDDIPYNFLIGEDGRAYECRGWSTEPYRHPDYDFLTGIGIYIAYFGHYRAKKTPPDISINTMRKLVRYGVEQGYIQQNYLLVDYEVDTRKGLNYKTLYSRV